jgi:hypothetical protein
LPRRGTTQLLMEPLKDWRMLSLTASPPETAIELFDASLALFVENQGQWADVSLRTFGVTPTLLT